LFRKIIITFAALFYLIEYTMKISSTLKMAAIAAIMLTAACTKDDTPTGMDVKLIVPSRLIGKWENVNLPTDFKRYTTTQANQSTLDSAYKLGKEWYVAEDVSENSEGVEFYWKIDGNKILEQKYVMGTWQTRHNTLTKLTDTELEYFDNAYTKYSFIKRE
jgi:hypothetical protein